MQGKERCTVTNLQSKMFWTCTKTDVKFLSFFLKYMYVESKHQKLDQLNLYFQDLLMIKTESRGQSLSPAEEMDIVLCS